jgi:hypothetical protein
MHPATPRFFLKLINGFATYLYYKLLLAWDFNAVQQQFVCYISTVYIILQEE